MENKRIKFILISPYGTLNAYGVRSISTYLRKNGIDVSVVYMPNSFNDRYCEKILSQLVKLCESADMVGISVMSNYFANSVQITRAIKKELVIPVVWGGVHPSLLPLECLNYCDIAVAGEGEGTILEILNNFKNNKPVYSILGVCTRYQGKIFQNSPRLPMSTEDFVILDNNFDKDYILVNEKLLPVTYPVLRRYMTSDYMTLSSFGCPFSCSYCVNNKLKKFYGSIVRFRKVDDIICELMLVKKKMNFVRHISFDDDAFIFRPPDEIKDFCVKYKEKINLPFFVSGFNPMYVTEEKIRLLISAGMDRVRMGIQTGSKTGKKVYNRRIPNEKIIEAANIINKFNHKLLLTGYDLILDNPFESKKDIVETINLLAKLPAPYTLNLFSLICYPGTDIYEAALSAGFIKESTEDIYKKHYLDIKNNYLNFIIILFALFKVPRWVLDYLLKEKFIKKNNKVPQIIFNLIIFLGLSRRGMNFLINGDVHTLLRHLRFNLKKT